MVKVYDNPESLGQLEEQWNLLQEQCGHASPFQSLDYVLSAWPYLQGKGFRMHVMAVLHKDGVVAIFPCCIDGKKTLRFINDRHTDFCNALVSPDCPGMFRICHEMAEHLEQCPEIRRVRLENMREDIFHSTLEYLLPRALTYSYYRYSHFSIPGPCAGEKSWIDSLSHLSPKEKYRLKNIDGKIGRETGGCSLSVHSAEDYPQEDIERLVKGMIGKGIRSARYYSESFLEIFRRFNESGRLTVAVSHTPDGQPLACNLFIYDPKRNEYIDWIAMYGDASHNSWNLLQFFRHVHDEGGGDINFARGVYKYKMHNFRPAVGSLTRLHWSKSRFLSILDILECSFNFFKKTLRHD